MGCTHSQQKQFFWKCTVTTPDGKVVFYARSSETFESKDEAAENLNEFLIEYKRTFPEGAEVTMECYEVKEG